MQMTKNQTKNKRIASDMLKNILSKYSMVFIFIALLLLFQYLTGGIIFRPLNVTNLILQNAYVLVLALGMLLVVLLGNVDLSVGSVVAFVGAVAGKLMVDMNWNPYIVIPLALIIGGIIGIWNGYWIAYLGIPSFVVTLGGLLMFRGLTQIILGGKTLAPFPEEFQFISSGYFPSLNPGGFHLLSVILGAVITIITIFMLISSRKTKEKNLYEVESMGMFITKMILTIALIMGVTWVLAQYRGYPFVLVILAFLTMIFSFVTKKTTIGRRIYATGGNRKAAQLSGVNTKSLEFWIFVNMGVMSALAGLVLASRLNASTPQAGEGFELDALAAVYIGGASTSGGIGTVLGTIIGALIMGLLNNGMSIMGVGVDWQSAIKGLILIFAVVFDVWNRKRKLKA
ncbi:multiple monosaccharide ABC transporter permease [Lacticigenium naphthae]|uniref:multiple monosaccharide ABC transporter permease n=1 Tax=Lacticigenium naphthae TaxID=515351 RepID=UPI00041706B7|nr:multiple monosaccharide ABC transporter permease [Lacticigenium naphthae]